MNSYLNLFRFSTTARWIRTVRCGWVGRSHVRGSWKQRLNLAANSAPKISFPYGEQALNKPVTRQAFPTIAPSFGAVSHDNAYGLTTCNPHTDKYWPLPSLLRT